MMSDNPKIYCDIWSENTFNKDTPLLRTDFSIPFIVLVGQISQNIALHKCTWSSVCAQDPVPNGVVQYREFDSGYGCEFSPLWNDI